MDPLLRFFQPTKRCPTGKRQHEKERRNQHPSWDTGDSDIYSGVQKKRWRTYWKYVKLHSITGQWGALPAENRGLKSAQGTDPLKASGALPFPTLICCIIKQEFTAKDKWGFFFHRRQPPSSQKGITSSQNDSRSWKTTPWPGDVNTFIPWITPVCQIQTSALEPWSATFPLKIMYREFHNWSALWLLHKEFGMSTLHSHKEKLWY